LTDRLLLIAALSLLVAGCSPCEEACRVETRQFEDCLADWDMDWIDLGALDKVDYRQTCVDETGVWLDGLSTEQRAAERSTCQALVTGLSGQTDCDVIWQALVDYGSLP
jgi:hypothetical protein